MGYSEAVTGRPTMQWQNEKGKQENKNQQQQHTQKSKE